MEKQYKIAVIGLGYVGLPLARLFATQYPVVGFDINQKRIEELRTGNDSTLEVEADVLQSVLVDHSPFNDEKERDSLLQLILKILKMQISMWSLYRHL